MKLGQLLLLADKACSAYSGSSAKESYSRAETHRAERALVQFILLALGHRPMDVANIYRHYRCPLRMEGDWDYGLVMWRNDAEWKRVYQQMINEHGEVVTAEGRKS